MEYHNRTVRQDVRELGALLGEILREQTSRQDFETVEELRTAAIAYRDGEINSHEPLHSTLDSLTPDEESIVARAFTSYFELINLAEDRQQVRRTRRDVEQTPIQGSPKELAAVLADADLTADQVSSLLKDVQIEPTFTGHPTEARRKTIKTKLRSIEQHLQELDERRLTDSEHDRIKRNIDAEVTSLWQTPHVRTRQPQPEDQARNIQWYLQNPIYETIGDVYDDLEAALSDSIGDVDVPQLMRFRSVAGGDREDNPYITPDVSESTLERQRERIIERYRDDLQELLGVLSQDGSRINPGEAFEKSISADRERLPGVAEHASQRYPGEPYRQKLILMRERLNRVGDVRPGGYTDPDEFRADLAVIAGSLRSNGADSVVNAHVDPLCRRAETFGFSLAALEFRDRAERHTATVSALFRRQNIDYEDRSESDRCSLLTEAICQTEPVVDITDWESFSEEVADVCERFTRIAAWQRQFGLDVIEGYGVSETERPSQILEVLFLADQADIVELPGHAGIDIVPIIETTTGFNNLESLFETLLTNEAYSQAISARDGIQEVNFGYADTTQEKGVITANWLINRAQRRLPSLCEEHGVTLRLFHGRGGPIARGDQPMNDAIQALPPATVTGQIRFTEGGEVVAEKYGNQQITKRNLEQMVHAQVCARKRARFEALSGPTDAWTDAMATISDGAEEAYRDLVDTDGFIQFFEEATPVSTIESLDLGSEPTTVSGTRNLNEIGAIPWSFAWTQTRLLIHGWYGFATGIDAYLDDGGELTTLQEMYNQWPFFATVIDYVALALGRTDIDIASEYAASAHPEAQDTFLPILKTEYERAVELITTIADRSHPIDRSWLRESLHRRNPYIKPLHLLQAHLLSQTHRTDTEERTLRLTIKGIAAGLKNTG